MIEEPDLFCIVGQYKDSFLEVVKKLIVARAEHLQLQLQVLEVFKAEDDAVGSRNRQESVAHELNDYALVKRLQIDEAANDQRVVGLRQNSGQYTQPVGLRVCIHCKNPRMVQDKRSVVVMASLKWHGVLE